MKLKTEKTLFLLKLFIGSFYFISIFIENTVFSVSRKGIKRITQEINPVDWRYSMQRRKYKKHKRPRSAGSNHWNWSHGNATKLTRQEQADTNCRLRYLCDIGKQGGFMSPTTKFMGRPPNDYLKLDLTKPENLTYALLKTNKLI